MSPLEAALVVLFLALPLLWIVRRELARLDEPGFLREHGVVIVSDRALEAHSAPIGEYRGHPIWGSVRFKGMEYRFDRVLERAAPERIGPHELLLAAALVYVTD